MTINAAIANYATEGYLEYYRNDGLSYLRDEAKNSGFDGVTDFISADIRDNYKQANLTDVFPSLLNLTEDAYDTEATFIHDLRSEIADRIFGLLQNDNS